MLPRAAVTLVAAARVMFLPELFTSPYVTPTVEPEPKRWCALAKLNDPAKMIMSIEDPVEYDLRGINQGQVNRAPG